MIKDLFESPNLCYCILVSELDEAIKSHEWGTFKEENSFREKARTSYELHLASMFSKNISKNHSMDPLSECFYKVLKNRIFSLTVKETLKEIDKIQDVEAMNFFLVKFLGNLSREYPAKVLTILQKFAHPVFKTFAVSQIVKKAPETFWKDHGIQVILWPEFQGVSRFLLLMRVFAAQPESIRQRIIQRLEQDRCVPVPLA